MNTFIKILKFVFLTTWTIFVFLVKAFLTIAGIFLKGSQKFDKGFYKEVEEKGHYTGEYDL